jgi:hypothetical protein
MRLRRQTLALMLITCAAAAWAADTLTAQVPVRTAPSMIKPAATPEQQIAALQQQVAVLQSQVNALMSAVQVSQTGVVLQGPTVMIAGQSVEIRSDMNATVRTGGALTVASSATLDLRGATLRFNNGSRPVATVGSLVQMQPNGSGQIINGSATVLAD